MNEPTDGATVMAVIHSASGLTPAEFEGAALQVRMARAAYDEAMGMLAEALDLLGDPEASMVEAGDAFNRARRAVNTAAADATVALQEADRLTKATGRAALRMITGVTLDEVFGYREEDSTDG